MSIARRNATITLLLQGSKYLTGLLALVVLARLLQPQDYGLVAECTAVVGLAAVVSDFGLSLAAIQAVHLSQQQKTTLFWLNTAIGILVGLGVAAAAPLLAVFYREPRLTGVTLALASVFVLNGLTVQFKVEVNRSSRFLALGMIELCSQAAGLVAAILAALGGLGYSALVLQQLVGAVAQLLFAILLARWIPGLPTSRGKVGGLVRFGRDTFAAHVANYITSNFDTVLIGRQLGPAVLGLYNRAFQLVQLPLDQLLAPLTRVFLPRLARMSSNDDLNRALHRAQLVLAYGVLTPLSLLTAAATPLLTVILGPQWAPADVLVRVLAIGAAFQTLGYVYYWAFLSRSRTGLLFLSELWGRVPMVILMLLLVHLGTIGVAAAASIGQVLMWLAGSTYYAARIGVRVPTLLNLALRPLLLFGVVASVTASIDLFVFVALPAPLRLLLTVGLWAMLLFLAVGIFRGLRHDLMALIHEVPPATNAMRSMRRRLLRR